MPPILAPSSAEHIATQILLITKLNGRKGIVLRGCVYDMMLPRKQLPVQSYQLKHKNKVGKLFKIKNEDTRTTSVALMSLLSHC